MFFEKINNIDKPLTRVIEKKKVRRLKSIKLEMKKTTYEMKKLQHTMQKY